MSAETGEPSPLFVQFLYHFNSDRDYFECHEVLEELWLEEGRDPLLQGLLQVAVALYHCRNDNRSGACKLFRQALRKLDPYPAVCRGIDLSRLRRESQVYLKRLEEAGEGPFSFYDLDIAVIDPALRGRLEALEKQSPG